VAGGAFGFELSLMDVGMARYARTGEAEE